MSARKTYTEETVTYGASGRKWNFVATAPQGGEYRFSTMHMPGGAVTAHKVARIINGGVKRTKKGDIDPLARANMAQIFHKAAAAVPRERVLNHQGLFAR